MSASWVSRPRMPAKKNPMCARAWICSRISTRKPLKLVDRSFLTAHSNGTSSNRHFRIHTKIWGKAEIQWIGLISNKCRLNARIAIFRPVKMPNLLKNGKSWRQVASSFLARRLLSYLPATSTRKTCTWLRTRADWRSKGDSTRRKKNQTSIKCAIPSSSNSSSRQW